MSQHFDWSERPEGGGRFAVWLLRGIGMYFGRASARAFLYPITLYFYLRRAPERRASRDFLEIATGQRAGARQVLRHLHKYAATILDRMFLLAEAFRRFDIRVNGRAALDAQIDRGCGVILLGAHIGSFEALRVLSGERPDVQVRVVMDRQQTPALTEMLHLLNPRIAENVIDAGGDPAVMAFAIKAAAEQGALIGLLGDRARPGEPVQIAEFFGKPASFPTGPYVIASLLELPIVLCFGLYRGANRYDLYFETFATNLKLTRTERARQLQEWAQRYATRLEHYTRLDPYNWFNFYDFWHRTGEQPARRSSAAAGVGIDSAA